MIKNIILWTIPVGLVFTLAKFSYSAVDEGNLGVYKVLGKAKESPLYPGLHFKVPFLSEVIMIDTRIQMLEVNSICYSSDQQSVSFTAVLNYQADSK